jgi:gluconokinase
MIVVLMGPAGAGKTTVGRALAEVIRWRFYDADDFHDAVSIERMRAGVALTDEERAPWLARIHDAMVDISRRGGNAVLACSALKRKYRETLQAGIPEVRWVYLQGDAALLRARLAHRTNHFAGPALVDTQLTDLEPPANALVLDARRPVEALVAEIRAAIDRRV